MLGRQVGTSLLRLPRCARLPVRSLPGHPPSDGHPIRTAAPSLLRLYAQTTPSRPGRPKKAVGEPSRPVKRDVKRAAKSHEEGAAGQKVKAKKAAAAAKKKPASAKKTKAKPKKAPLTDEQKTRLAERKARSKASKAEAVRKADLAELKRLALDPPPLRRHISAWMIFLGERQKAASLEGKDRAGRNAAFADTVKSAQDEYRNITPAQLEHYNHLTHTAKESEQAAYKKYVEAHTVEDIEIANKARFSLRRKLKGKPAEAKKWPAIRDERRVKRPSNAYAQFLTNRFASGDFHKMKASDAAKLIGKEWRELSAEEKKKYNNLYKQDSARYSDEYTSLHGHAPTHLVGEQPALAAAAAA